MDFHGPASRERIGQKLLFNEKKMKSFVRIIEWKIKNSNKKMRNIINGEKYLFGLDTAKQIPKLVG